MRAKTKIMSRITFGLIVTALCSPLSPFSYPALSKESDSRARIDVETNGNMYKEMQKIKNSLANRDIKSARESLAKMRQLAGNSVMYDEVINYAKSKIEEKEGYGTKVRTPMGAGQKARALPQTPDISDLDIKAFDEAFLTKNDIPEARRILNKYPRTPQDSAKKIEFLNYATEALGIMSQNEIQPVDPRKALYGTKTRTPMGAQKSPGPDDISDSDINAFKEAYETDNVVEAKRIFEKYPRTPQDSAKKIEFFKYATKALGIMSQNEKKPAESREALYGTKTRTPMGAQKSPGAHDISDSDIEAFKKAYETDNVDEMTRIFEKYPRTSQDSAKKKEFLGVAEIQMQFMR